MDHGQPRFAGGDHDLNNLRALCKKHNLHRYRQQAQRRFF
ncbi:MAG: HNH endonuclease [Bdellovibrio sp.]